MLVLAFALIEMKEAVVTERNRKKYVKTNARNYGMRYKLMIFLLLSAILLLAACSNGSTQTGMSDLNHTIIQATDEIQITISHVTDELLVQYGSFILFSHNGGTDEIAFIPNIPVKNFRYIKINGEEIMFIVEEDLVALDILLPSTPLVVDWTATGSMAYGGFAFDDENGTTRYFAFNYDAEGLTAFRWMEFDGRFSVFDESQETTLPTILTVDIIPQGVEPAEFIRELGYGSFNESSGLHGDDWIVLRTNSTLPDFYLISITPHYEAFFDGEWYFTQHHSYTWKQPSIAPSIDKPLVMRWQADDRYIAESGLSGVMFVEPNGLRRFFILRNDNGIAHLEEFVDDTLTALLEEEVDNTNSSNDTAIHSTDNIQVIVDGTEVTFDEQHPMIVDGHIMIPIRNVFEQLGADVELHEFGIGHQVIIRSPFTEAFIIGQEDMYIGSVPYTAVAPPQIINDAIKLSVDTLVEIFIRNGHYAAWDLESPTLNIFNNASATNALRIMNEAADNIRARGINAVVLQDGNVVDSYMLFARPGLGFSIFYITIDDEEFMAVNSELDGDQAADGIFVPGRTRTQFVTWRNERGPGSPIFAWTFIQIFDDEEALLRERFPN